jgi:hypothetical protein
MESVGHWPLANLKQPSRTQGTRRVAPSARHRQRPHDSRAIRRGRAKEHGWRVTNPA